MELVSVQTSHSRHEIAEEIIIAEDVGSSSSVNRNNSDVEVASDPSSNNVNGDTCQSQDAVDEIQENGHEPDTSLPSSSSSSLPSLPPPSLGKSRIRPSFTKAVSVPHLRQKDQQPVRRGPLLRNVAFIFICSLVVVLPVAAFDSIALDDSDWFLFMAPFGATTTIVLSQPRGYPAQPYCVIVGHTLGAITGLITRQSENQFTRVLAVPIVLLFHSGAKIFHPPAVATALLSATSSDTRIDDLGWFFIFSVSMGAVWIVCAATLVHNLTPYSASYPAWISQM